MAILNFDARNVAPDPGTPEPLPAGWYNVVMTSSDLKPTEAGGQRLAIVFQVIDGQFAQRKIFTGLNLVNANAAAQEIAYKQLSAIGHAVGHTMIGDSAELHNKPLKVKVKVKPAAGGYEASNDISAYKNINDPTAVSTGPANPFAPPPGVPAVGMPPGATAPAAWAPPPPAAPVQPWAPPPAAQAPQAPPAAAMAPPPVGMQPAWAAAPPPAAPAPQTMQAPQAPAAPAAPPQLQPPPGYVQPAAPAAAPVYAAPAAAAAAPAGAPAAIMPPWMTQTT